MFDDGFKTVLGLLADTWLIGLFLILVTTQTYAETTTVALADAHVDPLKPIVITAAAPIFKIKLKSNPSTGFIWQLAEIDDTLIEAVSHEYFSESVAGVGTGGYDIWTFVASDTILKLPRVTKIKFVSSRPWTITVTESVEFTVLSQKNNNAKD